MSNENQIRAHVGLSSQEKNKIVSDLKQEIASIMRVTHGVRFYGNSTTGVRIYDSANHVANVGLDNGQPVINDFDSMYPWSAIKKKTLPSYTSSGTEIVDNEGNPIYQVFNECPNVYFRYLEATDETGDYVEYSITSAPQEGYVPVFKNKDKTIPATKLIGCYKATWLDDTSNYIGCSKDKLPVVNTSINTTAKSKYVYTKNIDVSENIFQLETCGLEDYFYITLLMMIEFASRNMQSIMVGISSDSLFNDFSTNNTVTDVTNTIIINSSTYIVKNMSAFSKLSILLSSATRWISRKVISITADTPSVGLSTIVFSGEPILLSSISYIGLSVGTATGSTDDIIATSGSINSNSNGLNHFKYRGFEDFYGNLWETLDNIAIRGTYNAETLTAINKPEEYDYSEGQNYNDLLTWKVIDNIEMSLSEGYTKKLTFHGAKPFTTAVGASSDSYYCDYYYLSKRNSAGISHWEILAGGYCSNGANGGPFYFHCYNGWSLRHWSMGFRPVLRL